MRIKKNFSLRSLGDQFILVAEGNQMIDFSQMICMNNSAAFLWDAVKDIDFCSDTISKLIVDTFCIPQKEAEHDAFMILNDWKRIGLLE